MNPEPGITVDARVIRVLDGDTIEVEIKRCFKVRFKDYNAAELNTMTGKEAKDLLIKQFEDNNNVTLFIPTHSGDRLMDFHSFERVVADVWHEGKQLNANQD